MQVLVSLYAIVHIGLVGRKFRVVPVASFRGIIDIKVKDGLGDFKGVGS